MKISLITVKTRIGLMILSTIVLAIFVLVFNNMYHPISDSELQKNLQSEIQVNINPQNIIMKKGESKTINIEIQLNSDEPTEGKLWVYSIDLNEAKTGEFFSDGEFPAKKFHDIQTRGLAEGFSGKLSEEQFLLSKENSNNSKSVFLILNASENIDSGNYSFVHSFYHKSALSEGIIFGMFHITVKE